MLKQYTCNSPPPPSPGLLSQGCSTGLPAAVLRGGGSIPAGAQHDPENKQLKEGVSDMERKQSV